MALGAAPWLIVSRIVQGGMLTTLGGLAIGLPLALVLPRVLGVSVPGVTPEWAAFIAAPLIMSVIALSACVLPAWHAMQADPLISLR